MATRVAFSCVAGTAIGLLRQNLNKVLVAAGYLSTPPVKNPAAVVRLALRRARRAAGVGGALVWVRRPDAAIRGSLSLAVQDGTTKSTKATKEV